MIIIILRTYFYHWMNIGFSQEFFFVTKTHQSSPIILFIMSILSKGFFLTEFTGFIRWIFFVGVDSISTLCIFKHFGKNEILPLQIYLWQLGTCNVSLQPNIFRVCHRQNPYNIFLCTGFPLGNPDCIGILENHFIIPNS